MHQITISWAMLALLPASLMATATDISLGLSRGHASFASLKHAVSRERREGALDPAGRRVLPSIVSLFVFDCSGAALFALLLIATQPENLSQLLTGSDAWVSWALLGLVSPTGAGFSRFFVWAKGLRSGSAGEAKNATSDLNLIRARAIAREVVVESAVVCARKAWELREARLRLVEIPLRNGMIDLDLFVEEVRHYLDRSELNCPPQVDSAVTMYMQAEDEIGKVEAAVSVLHAMVGARMLWPIHSYIEYIPTTTD